MKSSLVTIFGLMISFQALGQEALPKVNVTELLVSSPVVEGGQAELRLCFTNADFKNNVDGSLHAAITRIQRQTPEAVTDLGTEVCIEPQRANDSAAEVDHLVDRMGALENVNLELIKPVDNSLTSRPAGPRLENLPIARQLLLTIRAAATGAAGALLVQKARPALDYLSNKGTPGEVSIAKGAAIGAITDAIQRLSGETDETKIAQRNFGASLVGSMVQTRDPNVIGLALILTLSQVPAVQRSVDWLAQNTPEKLDWKIPATMVAAFYLIGRNRSGEEWRLSKDKGLQAGTFGTLAAVVTATHQGHETSGFIVASAASLLDELCDAATKKCQGRFSLADLAFNTVGAFIGAKVAGLIVSPTRHRVNVQYYKEFSL